MSSAYLQDGGYKATLKRFEPEGPLFVQIRTSHGSEWISTGQTTFPAAREITRRADVLALEKERAAALLARDIQRRQSTAKTCLVILEEWNAYLEPISSPHYRYDLVSYVRLCLEEMALEDKLPGEVGHDPLSRWVNVRKLSTRQNRLKSLRTYFDYARSMGYCQNNPAELVRIRLRDMTIEQRTPKKTEPITAEEYLRLTTSGKLSAFWHTLVVVAYWTGLRMRDIICLEWASIKEDRLITYQQKTGDKVEHPFTDEAVAGGELQAALLAIPRNDSAWCFPAERLIALDPAKRGGFSATFADILKAHGIVGKKFHGCRHGAAVRLKNLGRDTKQVQQTLGHRSRWSTEHYLDHGDDASDCL